MGFEEIPHTADCAIRVWGSDMVSLFVDAARGMNSLAGATIGPNRCIRRKVSLSAMDPESLIVSFLTDLVFAQEQEKLGFNKFDLRINANHLSGVMEGSSLHSLIRPIKAVTYHNLGIRETSRGYEVEIVFDV